MLGHVVDLAAIVPDPRRFAAFRAYRATSALTVAAMNPPISDPARPWTAGLTAASGPSIGTIAVRANISRRRFLSRAAVGAQRAAERGDFEDATRHLRRWSWDVRLIAVLLVVATWDMISKPGF